MRFNTPGPIVSDGGNLWIGDAGNRRLRVAPTGELPVAREASFGDDGYGPWDEDVNTGLGNFVTSATDVSVASPGPDLELTRSYNSLDTRAGAFGAGWSFTYAMSWSYLGEGVVVSVPRRSPGAPRPPSRRHLCLPARLPLDPPAPRRRRFHPHGQGPDRP